MKETVITVTEAARNFADCINRTYYQNTTFVLLKNGKAVARLVPERQKVCNGQDLAEAIGKVELSAQEARAWLKDMASSRKRLFAPRDKWQ